MRRSRPLPPPSLRTEVPVEQLFARRHSVRAYADTPLELAVLGQLLWAAQGLRNPKGKRTAPSAGALYPLELHVVAGAVDALEPGVYRYAPHDHALEPGIGGDLRAELARAARDQSWMGEAPATVVIGAVFERTRVKYGRRAPRYVHIEAGHAAENLFLQAVALGLGSVVVGAFRDDEVAGLLDLPSEVRPLILMPVGEPAPST